MKIKRFLLLGLLSLPFLHGCGFDEGIEGGQQRDGDDFNVINDIGPQALDQVFQGKGRTTSIVVPQTNAKRSSSLVVQTAAASQAPEEQTTSSPQTEQVVQTTPSLVVQPAPSSVVQQREVEQEDSFDTENN